MIGDLHELPILDIGINDFTATAENWSSSLKAEAAIDMYSNVYNFSKSSWEPLLEPWQVGLGVARDPKSGLLSIDVTSKKIFDTTITTATIALASKSFDFLTTEQDVLGNPRGTEAPYKMKKRHTTRHLSSAFLGVEPLLLNIIGQACVTEADIRIKTMRFARYKLDEMYSIYCSSAMLYRQLTFALLQNIP